MRTLEERIVRVQALVPTRPTEEPEPGETASTIHFCMQRADGVLLSIAHGMQPFTPPDDDSTIVVFKVRSQKE